MKAPWLLVLLMGLAPAMAAAEPSSGLIAQAEVLAGQQKEETEILKIWSAGISHWVKTKDVSSPEIYDLRRFLSLPEKRRKKLLSQFPKLAPLIQISEANRIPVLDKKMGVGRTKLAEQIHLHPEALPALIGTIQNSTAPIDDEILDQLFGIDYDATEAKVAATDGRHAWQEKGDTQTRYDAIREMFKMLALRDSDVFYDLGSGHGRIQFYGACIFPKTTFKGIEIEHDRVDASNRIVQNTKLTNVSFVASDVLDASFSDGTVFYLFNPFSLEVLDPVVERLHQLAAKKRIRIVAVGWASVRDFAHIPWLKMTGKFGGEWDTHRGMIFESR